MNATSQASPGGLGKVIGGFLAGLLLSGAYIQFNWVLPGWMRLPGLVQSLGPRTVADSVLEDPQAEIAARQRALEELFRHDPSLFRELDDALDHAITRAAIHRKVQHRLVLFQNKQRTLRTSLETHDALREAAMRQHGASDFEDLLLRMGNKDLEQEPLLQAYLLESFPQLKPEDRLPQAMALSPTAVFPSSTSPRP